MTVNRKKLETALKRVATVIPSRPALPVLAGAVVERRNGWLLLSAFDYETSLRTEVRDDSPDMPRIIVSGRQLRDLVAKVKADTVTIDVDGSKLTVTAGGTTYRLVTLPADDYPALPDLPPQVAQFTAAQHAAWARVAVAAGNDMTLPTLTGMSFQFRDGAVSVAATDRYRLHVLEQTPFTGTDLSANILAPASAVMSVSRMAKGLDLNVGYDGTRKGGAELVSFSFDDDGVTFVTVRLLDGEFPKYRALIPTEASTTVLVDRARLLDAVKAVSLVAERNTPVRLTLTDDRVTLKTGAGDETTAESTVDAVRDGDDVDEVAFNPDYLAESLEANPSNVVRLAFVNSTRPGLFTPVDDDLQLKTLLMPVRMAG